MDSRLRQSILWGCLAVLAGLGCADAKANWDSAGESNLQSAVDVVPNAAPAGPNVSSVGTDPGPRAGAACTPSQGGCAGGFFPTLNLNEQGFFTAAAEVFAEVDSVAGAVAGENGTGLGPQFNGNSCAMCHAQPAVGGSSPGLKSPQHPVPNPQVALATLDGATNTVPSFITAAGPVREARFVVTSTADHAPFDGGVHALYTIKGRSDAPGCNLAQPDFATQIANNNIIFRIPTPLFGLGLVENTTDASLRANLAANASTKSSLGISGKFNTSGNDGTITRFGWKAQNKSLLIFSGEAYNVEQGVTNELFGNERSEVASCIFNATPEDATHSLNPDDGTDVGTATTMSGDVISFAAFMRLSAPPTPAAQSTSAQNGSKLFDSVGCVQCHSRNLTTAKSRFTGMSNVTFHPFSDFALHHMGSVLADGVVQGAAVADEFRTAPLWGVGQRLFFLHDGRTSDLGAAIEAHADTSGNCTTVQNFEQFVANAPGTRNFDPFVQTQTCTSEANTVVNNYNALSASQQTDLLNFLRTL